MHFARVLSFYHGPLTLKMLPPPMQSISTFSLQGKRSSGPVPESLLVTVKNRQLQICSSWNIKLHSIVRVYDHASVSNFCIIFVLLVCMYCEDRAPSDDNCCIESMPIIHIDCCGWDKSIGHLNHIKGISEVQDV